MTLEENGTIMKRMTSIAAIGFALVTVGSATAAPSPEEIAELGKTLTPLGAIRAGNDAGTIPAWDGGLCSPPPGYAPMNSRGGPPYVDPFASESPLYSVTAANVQDYASLLPAGTQELLRRNPGTHRIDVYPSHRTACHPQWVYQNTIDRAGKPRLVGDAPGVADAHAQIPFPIPKSGTEAMWNALLVFHNTNEESHRHQFFVDSAGRVTLVNTASDFHYRPYWDNERTSIPDDEPFWSLVSVQTSPASRAGTADLRRSYTRADIHPTRAWSYIPGQRRVRQAPEFTYDTVSTNSGMLLFDEINGFDGRMDRFDFTLIGRKEILVPYNSYRRWEMPINEAYVASHVKPERQRWELHRVWVVEATLKEGMRHTQQKKVFYLDEDSWNILVYESFDHQGGLHHYMELHPIQLYENPQPRGGYYDLYDFATGALTTNGTPGPDGRGNHWVEPFPPNTFTPQGLSGRGVR